MNETYDTPKENIYFELLEKCNKQIDELSNQLSFVSRMQPGLKSEEIASATQLEARIIALLNRLVYLKEDLKI